MREGVKFIFYDLMYGLTKSHELSQDVMSQPEGSISTYISTLRQRVTEYMKHCENLLKSSPHKSVSRLAHVINVAVRHVSVKYSETI